MGTTRIMALALGTLLNLEAGCGNDEVHGEAYYPHSVGDMRIYDSTVTSSGTTSTSQGTQVVTAGDYGFFRVEQTTDPGSVHTATHLVIDDAGISIEEQVVTAGTSSFRSNYRPGILFLQRDLSTASTVTMTSTMSASAPSGLTSQVQLTSTVDGPADVTVPAGTFSTLKVTTMTVTMSTYPGSPTTSTSTSITERFWAKGVGLVKSITVGEESGIHVSSELVSYSLH